MTAGLLGAANLPREGVHPPWLTWSALAGDASSRRSESDAELADRLIFQAAYHVLGERDQAESWSPSEVLEAVAAAIATAKPNDEVSAIIDRNIRRVRELINVERGTSSRSATREAHTWPPSRY